jgi:hypothetical protein
MLKEKALHFAARLGVTKNFRASNGWTDRLKQNHYTVYNNVRTE